MSKDAQHLRTGEEGEALAVAFLQERGLTIEARNYRWSRAEVDVIAMGSDILHFVEVKTRHWRDVEQARQAVTRKKEGLIKGAAGRYMEDAGYAGDFQFDVIVVILERGGGSRVVWMADAFGFEN